MTAIRILIAGVGIAGVGIVASACGSGTPRPAALDPGGQACQYCRMVLVDRRFASQIVAAYEEPRFFDDLGCLNNYLKGRPALPDDAVVYVADHGTTAWVPGRQAVYTRVEMLSAPMGSHIIAHENAASRQADREAAAGSPVTLQEVFPAGLPGTRQ